MFPSDVEGPVIDSFALLCGYFEGVDNLDFTTILSPKESTKDYRKMRPDDLQKRSIYTPKGMLVFFCSLRRVKCSEMFKIGRGCLG